MARKRMFDSEIISQDSFIDLPMEAKALYFLLGMEADDEGFVNYKKVLRLYGGTEDSIKILAMKQFIIPFHSGVIVVTDWKRNNYLDKNRLKETIYQNEKNQLTFNEITEKYELLLNPLKSSVKHSLNNCLTRIDENRVEENRREEYRVVEAGEETTTYQAPASTTPNNSDRPEEQAPLSQTDINIFQYLENNFGRTISHSEVEQIHSYQGTFSEDIIKEAIDRSCANNIKTIGYVKGILNSWTSKGFKTLEQCQKELEQPRKAKNSQQNYVAPEPDWLNQEIKRKEVVYTDELQREYEEFERAIKGK